MSSLDQRRGVYILDFLLVIVRILVCIYMCIYIIYMEENLGLKLIREVNLDIF